VATGYTKDESDCQNRAINGSCTLVNTPISKPQEEEIFYEGFEDGNYSDWVTSGSVEVSNEVAIQDYSLRHISTIGYTQVSVTMKLAGTSLENNDGCFAEASTDYGGSWITVVEVQDGSDNGVFLSGTVTPAGADDNPTLQLRFRSTGKHNNDRCYGDEVIVTGLPINEHNSSFTVYKDYSDNNTDSVSVTLSCSSGTVTNSPQWASEAAPAVFTIEGAASNATCTATETSVATGYTKDESDCQNRAINGSCTLINILDANQQELIWSDGFEDRNTNG
jgi:hypothetical protein